MTENEMMNGWTFEETIKTAENLMKEENNVFKRDVLRHLRDFAEHYKEQLEQYIAIGLTPELIEAMQGHNIALINDLWEYQKIGTIEEFKALKEKNEPKKILYRKQSYGTPWLCPYCEADQIKVEFFSEDGSEPKEKYTFCWQCGTRIDWSE